MNEEIIVKNGKVEKRYSYADENNMESMNFSLGELYFLVTNGQKENFVNGYIYDKNIIKGYKSRKSLLTGEFINKHIVNYFDELLDDSIFSKKNRKNEIANYLIDLANDVKTIRLKRNAGSHANSMTIDEAEVCADFMIKVKKIIYNFIIKIKPEYRKGYNI